MTTVPGLLGYRHIGNEVKLSKDGDVMISCISTDNVREGEFLANLIPKLKGEKKKTPLTISAFCDTTCNIFTLYHYAAIMQFMYRI